MAKSALVLLLVILTLATAERRAIAKLQGASPVAVRAHAARVAAR